MISLLWQESQCYADDKAKIMKQKERCVNISNDIGNGEDMGGKERNSMRDKAKQISEGLKG